MKENAAFPDLFIIPTDFSYASLNACRFALELAVKFRARIKLIHAYTTPEIIPLSFESPDILVGTTTNELRENAEKKFSAFLDQISSYAKSKSLTDIPVSTHLINGNPEEIVLYTSEAENAALIIMGLSGTEVRSFEPTGKIASRIIEKSTVPVLIIPEEMEFKGIDKIKNLLYTTTFDESDFQAIGKLINIIQKYELNIYCLHIGENEDPWDRIKMDGLKEYFNKVYGKANVESDLIFSRDIIQALDNYIASKKIDLLTITKHKRNILSKLINPSLTLKIIYHTRIPLLVFKV